MVRIVFHGLLLYYKATIKTPLTLSALMLSIFWFIDGFGQGVPGLGIDGRLSFVTIVIWTIAEIEQKYFKRVYQYN